jgi:hypothetical protein
MKTQPKKPVFRYKNGRRTAVTLDIRVYRDLLRIAEDAHDIREVTARRKKKGDSRPLEEALKELELQ